MVAQGIRSRRLWYCVNVVKLLFWWILIFIFFVAVGIYNELILNPMLFFMGIDLLIEGMRNSLFWKLFSADYLVLYQKSVEEVV